jgi:hypothetical protein
VLALDPDGHLVVVELKRDEAPETVELQALKYAAFCSRFTRETLVEEYRTWRRQNAKEDLDAETATARLESHLAEDVGGLAAAPLDSPRIVLLAGSFSPSTTAVAVWLRHMGVDITLRALRAYRTGSGPVFSVSAVYPTPSVEGSWCHRRWPSGSRRRPTGAPPAPSRPCGSWSPAVCSKPALSCGCYRPARTRTPSLPGPQRVTGTGSCGRVPRAARCAGPGRKLRSSRRPATQRDWAGSISVYAGWRRCAARRRHKPGGH